jgi:hypothetical protein
MAGILTNSVTGHLLGYTGWMADGSQLSPLQAVDLELLCPFGLAHSGGCAAFTAAESMFHFCRARLPRVYQRVLSSETSTAGRAVTPRPSLQEEPCDKLDCF